MVGGANAGKAGAVMLGAASARLGAVRRTRARLNLTLIATAESLDRAALLLACSSAGAAVPMLLIAYGGQYISTRARRLIRDARSSAGLWRRDHPRRGCDVVPVRRRRPRLAVELLPGHSRTTLMMNRPVNPSVAVVLSAAAATATVSTSRAGGSAFSGCGEAPGLTGIERWLNSEALSVKGLRGKVVLIDFWTYSCIDLPRRCRT